MPLPKTDIMDIQSSHSPLSGNEAPGEAEQLIKMTAYIPGYAHVNRLDSWELIFANTKWESLFDRSVAEMIATDPHFIQRHFHPFFWEKMKSEINERRKNAGPQKELGHFQKLRRDPKSGYTLLICFSRIYQEENCILTRCHPVNVFPDNAGKINRLAETNEFLEKNKKRIATLTPREMEVLHLIGKGIARKTIAGRLHISTNTLDNHRKHIRKKLAIKSPADLFRYIYALGLD